MPTRLRVDLAGYHHVVNRSVNRSVVFDYADDKEMFLQIINKSATTHKVILHDYSIYSIMRARGLVISITLSLSSA